jgi:hypothetical protein
MATRSGQSTPHASLVFYPRKKSATAGRMKQLFALIALSLFCSCAAMPAAVSVDRERATECVQHCASLDMTLSAIVVIANRCGCVCEPAKSGASAESGASLGAVAAAGGMAAVLAAEQSSNDQSQQQQQSQRNRRK